MRQLVPIDLVNPGKLGLNLQFSGSLLDAGWCSKASNCVLDVEGRIAARDGYTVSTGTAIGSTPPVLTVHEYITGTGASSLIIAWDGGIGTDIDDPSGSDISGAVTDTNGHWNFQNFNEKVIGFQAGQKPIVYTGTGSFATVVESGGTAPTSALGVGLCAFGRVWGLDSDGQTVKYCGLLDETDWNSASAGSIDMSKVWTGGMDSVTAIAAHNGSILVFGKNHIVIWDDLTGSQLGFDPVNMSVVDVVQGTGCLAQSTIAHVGEADILFLSRHGVQSLGRLIQEKSTPISNISKYVRSALLGDLEFETLTEIKSTYNPEEGFYVLSLPTVGTSYVFNFTHRFQDKEGELILPATTWTLAPTALCSKTDGSLLMGGAGVVLTYGSLSGDNGTLIYFDYESAWLDLGEQIANHLKFLKRIGSVLYVKNNSSIVFKWMVDFQDSPSSIARSVQDKDGAEWNIAEFSIAEWSGGVPLRILKVPARGAGQYYKVGVSSNVSDQFAIQQLELFTKVGRIA